jgi:DNA-binding transcriptional LysR family regulator
MTLAATSRSTVGWDDFRLVKAVADATSLPAAADALGLNHSTVFRRLRQIEKDVGHVLFERHRGGYVPTPAGEEMIATATTMADGVSDFERRVAGRDMAPCGEVRLTASDTLFLHLLVPMLVVFRARFPLIRLDIVLANQGLNLSRRDADVALRATDAPPETLVGRRLARLGWALYAPAGTPPEGAPNWVTLGEGFANLAVVRRLTATVPPERIVCRINTVLGLAEAIEAGLGIGYLPCFIADPRPGLQRLAEPDDAHGVSLWLLTHPDLKHLQRVRAVMDTLADEIGKVRPLLEGDAG